MITAGFSVNASAISQQTIKSTGKALLTQGITWLGGEKFGKAAAALLGPTLGSILGIKGDAAILDKLDKMDEKLDEILAVLGEMNEKLDDIQSQLIISIIDLSIL